MYISLEVDNDGGTFEAGKGQREIERGRERVPHTIHLDDDELELCTHTLMDTKRLPLSLSLACSLARRFLAGISCCVLGLITLPA